MDESWSSLSYLVEASSFHNSVGLLNGHTVAILHCFQRAERSRGQYSCQRVESSLQTALTDSAWNLDAIFNSKTTSINLLNFIYLEFSVSSLFRLRESRAPFSTSGSKKINS